MGLNWGKKTVSVSTALACPSGIISLNSSAPQTPAYKQIRDVIQRTCPFPYLKRAPTPPWALPRVPQTSSLPGLQGSWFLGGQGSISQKAAAGGHFPERLRDKGIRKVLPSGSWKGEARRWGTQILKKVIFSFQSLPQLPQLILASELQFTVDNKSPVV